MSNLRRLFAAILVALFAGAAFAQDPEPNLADLQLDDFEVVPVGDGLVRVDAVIRIGACGEAQELKSSLRLISDGKLVAESEVLVSTGGDIGGKCANTRNGSCSGVACPDAIINGKRRAGTCKDGTMGGLCVCDYGVVSATFDNVAVQQGSLLELALDGEDAVREVSEGNNYGSITVGAKIDGSDLTVFTLDDPVTLEGLSKAGLVPDVSEDGILYASRSLEKVGDTTWVVQRGLDKEGNCRSWASDLAGLKEAAAATSHSCTGDPCSSCIFKYGTTGGIIGCTCLDTATSSRCNHTITSGSSF